MKVETGGNCEVRGKSGEKGCLQFLPSTWQQWSRQTLGYVPPMTKTNELYVASTMIQTWIDSGLTAEEIATMWNSGQTTHRAGTNKYGVAYNTRTYAQKVLSNL